MYRFVVGAMSSLLSAILAEECKGDRAMLCALAGFHKSHLSKVCGGSAFLGAPATLALSWAFPARAEELWRAFVVQPYIAKQLALSKAPRPESVAPPIARGRSALGTAQSLALAAVERLLREIPEGDGRWIKGAVGAFAGAAETARPLLHREPKPS